MGNRGGGLVQDYKFMQRTKQICGVHFIACMLGVNIFSFFIIVSFLLVISRVEISSIVSFFEYVEVKEVVRSILDENIYMYIK